MKNYIFKILFVLLFVGSVASLSWLTNSNHDKDFKLFTDNFNDLTSQMIEQLANKPLPEALDESQKVLVSKKTILEQDFDKLQKLSGSQVSQKTQINFKENLEQNSARLAESLAERKVEIISNPQLLEKTKKLLADYQSIVQ